MLPDLYLLSKYLIPDILPTLAIIGPPSKHELIPNDTHCKIIYSTAMVLSAHDFRSHVAGRATSVLGVLRRPYPRNSHVRDSHIPRGFHHTILRLNVAMDNTIIVHVFQSDDDARDHETSFDFCEAFAPSNMEPQVAACQEVAYQVQVLFILESVVHVDEEGVLELSKQLALVDNGIDGTLGNYARLAHLLHRVQHRVLLLLHLPHLPEAASANYIVKGETVLVYH